MSFFDHIVKRISDVGENVFKQSKSDANIVRLNNEISQKKDQMSSLIWQMGQDYYLKHKKDTSCEEQTYIYQINALFAEVTSLQDEIAQLNRSKSCHSCGSVIPEGALYCTNCGVPVVQTINEEGNTIVIQKRCPSCAKIVDSDSDFCCHCGTDMRNS